MTPPRQSDRVFGFTFAVVFTVLFAIGWLAFDARPYWALGLAGIFLLLALAAPGILMPLNRIWNRIAHLLAILLNFVVLGTFYVVALMPVGVALKVLGRDPMARRLGDPSDSYWVPVERHTTSETLRDMF